MQDPPSTAVILELANAGDEARGKFEARLAAAAMELVKRGEELAAASEAAELERLRSLLGESGDLLALNRRLCAAIRDGALSLSSSGVAAHLRATTLEKLAIDQPTYAAYRRALEASKG